MKKKDWSKVIGIIGSGGFYGPSNQLSEEKLKQVFPDKWPLIFKREDLFGVRFEAYKKGFEILIFHKGLNR